MKVLNLESSYEFNHAAENLSKLILSSGFKPDVVVGIPTGGRFVTEAMFDKKVVNLVYMKKQRVMTKSKKKSLVSNVIRFQPRFIQDLLRLLEHGINRLINLFTKSSGSVEIIDLRESAIDMIKTSKKILVVDDAIDTGHTMLSVLKTINKHNPNGEVKVACINTTFPNPLVYPDFCLYKKVLVRYPWAIDAREYWCKQ